MCVLIFFVDYSMQFVLTVEVLKLNDPVYPGALKTPDQQLDVFAEVKGQNVRTPVIKKHRKKCFVIA